MIKLLTVTILSLYLCICDVICCCSPNVFCDADTERAVGLLRRYQANLTSPDEQTLKNSVGKVSAILGSQLFQALLGKEKKSPLISLEI